ncbi:MAG: GNAT family N-acetyltransferase [Lautropia sp.]|nr:GNAT family N-acetyltransferase [Lautropia sp.]
MSRWIEPISLQGRHVRIEPMTAAHRGELEAAAADGELWKLWYTSVPDEKALDGWIAAALRQREDAGAMPFVVRRSSDDRLVGATRYFNVAAEHRRLEIGHTFFSHSVHRTAVNTETKLLLLAHAFDALRCVGVEFRTHFMNHPSRRAIERLGAKLDGVLRSHQVMPDGSLRDTCVFSIVAPEWPAVRNNLSFRLSRT